VASVLSRQPPALPTVVAVVVVVVVLVVGDVARLPPPARDWLARSLHQPAASSYLFYLAFTPDHPPLADVSASRIASVSHPMANATSESRRG